MTPDLMHTAIAQLSAHGRVDPNTYSDLHTSARRMLAAQFGVRPCGTVPWPADMLRARAKFLRHMPRKFPPFQRGMSTSMYIKRFADLNPMTKSDDLRGAAHVLPYDLDAYRRAAPVPDENPTNGIA